jgi:AraC-like DNA-binding protein
VVVDAHQDQVVGLHAQVVPSSGVTVSALSDRVLAESANIRPVIELRRGGRMLRAMALLAAPGQSVQDTSWAVGFDSLSSFTRAFTQFCGETPTTYRKRLGSARV